MSCGDLYEIKRAERSESVRDAGLGVGAGHKYVLLEFVRNLATSMFNCPYKREVGLSVSLDSTTECVSSTDKPNSGALL